MPRPRTLRTARRPLANTKGPTMNRHHTITAAANLRTIATLYPDLETALGTKEQHNNAGYITGSKPGSALPLNTKASEVKGEIDTWTNHLAQALIDNIDWKLPNPPTTPRILKDIADFRIGHLDRKST